MSISVFKKTLTYSLSPSANPSDITNNISTLIGTGSIVIPEHEVGKPVKFTSAILYIATQDVSTVTGATISNIQVSCSVNGTQSLISDANAINNSGENWAYVRGPYDFTNLFTASFGTAKSASVEASFLTNITTGTGTNTRANYCWMDITYEYSASATNRGQTLYIPMNGNSGSLPTTQTKFATIPQISGSGGLMQSYNNMGILNSYIELRGNCNATNNASDITLSYTFDGNASSNTLPVRENALGSDTYNTYIIPYPAASASSAHTFELWSSVSSRYFNMAMFLCITCEYDPSGMTTILNNIRIPLEFESPISGNTSDLYHRFHRTVSIPEPNPIVAKFIGIDLTYNNGNTATPNVRSFGLSTFTPYAMTATQVAGVFGLLSTPSASTQVTFSRGDNSVSVDLYKSAGSMTNVCGHIHLIYESNIYTSGSDYHSKYVSSFVRQFSHIQTSDTSVTDYFSIPEPNYWIQGIGLNYTSVMQATNETLMIQVRQNSNESFGTAWREVYNDQYSSDSEISYASIKLAARDIFMRFPLDYDSSRIPVTASRSYRTTSSTSFRYGYSWGVSYHCCTYSLSGTVSNSNGGTIVLSLFKESTGEKMQETSRAGDGSFVFLVYDAVSRFYVDAYEDDVYKGRSISSPHSGSFDISLFSTGGASETSHTWVG